MRSLVCMLLVPLVQRATGMLDTIHVGVCVCAPQILQPSKCNVAKQEKKNVIFPPRLMRFNELIYLFLRDLSGAV